MSIATAITAAQGKVANAYTAVNNKGGTLPATQNLSNLPTAINSIPSGGSSPVISSLNITPTTSQQTITAPSGTDGYSPITVSAVTSSIDANITAGNIKNGVSILGVTGSFTGSSEFASYQVSDDYLASRRSGALTGHEFSDIMAIDDYGFDHAFYNCTGLTGTLVMYAEVSGRYGLNYAFANCTGITRVDFELLDTIGQYGLNYAFANCTGLTRVDFEWLVELSSQYGLNYAFANCTGLTRVKFYYLAAITARAFQGCTSLESIEFESLSSITGSAAFGNTFNGCTGLKDVYFPALKTTSFGNRVNQFNNMLSSTGTDVTHTLHFPSNLRNTISGLTGYPTFGGDSGYVTLAFDL